MSAQLQCDVCGLRPQDTKGRIRCWKGATHLYHCGMKIPHVAHDWLDAGNKLHEFNTRHCQGGNHIDASD